MPFLFSATLSAQSFEIGVKGGLPLTDAFSSRSGAVVSYASVTRRYVAGPTVEAGPPRLGLRVEADALYRRVGGPTRWR
jgi:hypothetical protein